MTKKVVSNIKKATFYFCIVTAALIGVALMFAACSKESKTVVDPYSHITGDNITTACTSPKEMHPVSGISFPMEALVVRHKDCLGVDDMFFVIWPGENTETKRTGAKLLMLLYLDWNNDNNKAEKLISSLLKVDKISSSDGSSSHIAVYSLATKKIDTSAQSPNVKEGEKL